MMEQRTTRACPIFPGCVMDCHISVNIKRSLKTLKSYDFLELEEISLENEIDRDFDSSFRMPTKHVCWKMKIIGADFPSRVLETPVERRETSHYEDS
jgi:hypothetical protein